MSPASRYPVDWCNTVFLSTTLAVALTATPAFVYHFGIDLFQISLFLFYFAATGLSITLGYHRLYAHQSFKASWPVRIWTLVFGAAAFENSALNWAADHRRHHKHTDHEEDPYDISKGFFHAHIGWILFRCQPKTSFDCVKDLQQDRLVMWQHRYYLWVAIPVAFGIPPLLGWLYGGWISALGAFLLAGVTRIVFVHHMTFCINSLCHTLGQQPYSSRCSARDSALMAWFTFGEGYHNFHHEFQHDYRNGVKPWQFDPTKWSIWLLHKLTLVRQLRRVPEDKIILAEAAEQHRRMADALRTRPVHVRESLQHMLETAQARLQSASAEWVRLKAEYRRTADMKMQASRERLEELRQQLRESALQLRAAWQHWQNTRRLVMES